MVEPSVQELPRELARAARTVAERLAPFGIRAWIVGGAVRDLMLGREVHDVDMVSCAQPEQIEQAFERTIPVGRAFGTVVLPMDGCEVQMAAFRAETGYSDRRRPDQVRLGVTLEEDARRRDFTCNALYLDPLNNELRDPVDGAADLRSRVLRTVGPAASRFREDGLRLLRMARFEAGLGLQPTRDLHSAARAEREALVGVSVERVLGELARIFTGENSQRAMEILASCGLLERILPGAGPVGADIEHRHAVHGRLPEPPGTALGLALWLEADPDSKKPGTHATSRENALALRTSRDLTDRLSDLWRLRRTACNLASELSPTSDRILAMREPAWPEAVQLARAWNPQAVEDLEHLESWRQSLSPEQLNPSPWITSRDLADAGIPRGPAWGTLLRDAERHQLDGLWESRAQALDWLRG
ncbi:MAG: tRNA nucleotidyltransferase/poly(A) polymerase [Chlamydiales bacterium]|jgi:tRNA nucleotidyltransferase/poly(A) polymerase